jgi:hypothetical protein
MDLKKKASHVIDSDVVWVQPSRRERVLYSCYNILIFQLSVESESCRYLHEYAQNSNHDRSICKEEYDIVMLPSHWQAYCQLIAELDRTGRRLPQSVRLIILFIRLVCEGQVRSE